MLHSPVSAQIPNTSTHTEVKTKDPRTAGREAPSNVNAQTNLRETVVRKSTP